MCCAPAVRVVSTVAGPGCRARRFQRPGLEGEFGGRCVRQGGGHSRHPERGVHRADGSHKTGEELGMKTAAFPQSELSRKLETCLVIDIYI